MNHLLKIIKKGEKEFDKAYEEKLFTIFDYGCDGLDECCGMCGGDIINIEKLKIFQKQQTLKLLEGVRKEIENRKGKTPWFPEDFENINLWEKENKNHDWNIRQKSINENIKDLLDQQKSEISSLLSDTINQIKK